MKEAEQEGHWVNTTAVYALEYGAGELSKWEEYQVKMFRSHVERGTGHWAVYDGSASYRRCEITGLLSECEKVVWVQKGLGPRYPRPRSPYARWKRWARVEVGIYGASSESQLRQIAETGTCAHAHVLLSELRGLVYDKKVSQLLALTRALLAPRGDIE